MGDRRKVSAIVTIREARNLELQKEVVRYYQMLAREIAKQFLDFGIDGVNSAITNQETKLVNALIRVNGGTVDAIGNKQLNIIERRVLKQFNFDFSNQMQFFLAARALKTASLVSGTDRAQASSIIISGFSDGLTNVEIAKSLSAQFTSIATAYRAARIARTETAIVAAESQNVAAKESGVELVKQWLAIDDDRTRVNHKSASVDEQIRELDGTFQVGFDVMKGPHDPSASAGNVVNCRCVLNYIPKSIL